MAFLRSNLKSLILAFSFGLSVLIYTTIHQNSSPLLSTIRLVQDYGFISLLYLFMTMFAGPFYRVFPDAPFKQIYRESLSGLGIGCFYFALLHSYIGFFSLLAGFTGLSFLSTSYLWSVLTGAIALFILALLAGTSFDLIRKKMGPWWKFLHRFVYWAAFLTVIHVLILGSDFIRFTSASTSLSLIGFLILLSLHSITTYKLLASKYPKVNSYYFGSGIFVIVTVFVFLLYKLHLFIAGAHLH